MANKKKTDEKDLGEEAVEEALPDTEIIEEDLVVEEEEDESLRDQFVRLQADFANFRNRTQRERIELYQRANEDLLLEILPVLDHYEMGLQTAEQQETAPAVLDGFKLVYDQFKNVLDKFNLKPIDAVGEVFDPHKHEALTHMPSDEFPAEVCSNQVRRGPRRSSSPPALRSRKEIRQNDSWRYLGNHFVHNHFVNKNRI